MIKSYAKRTQTPKALLVPPLGRATWQEVQGPYATPDWLDQPSLSRQRAWIGARFLPPLPEDASALEWR